MFPFGIGRVWILGIPALLQVIAALDYLWAWHSTEPTRHRYLVQGTVMLIASFAVPLAAIILSLRRRSKPSQPPVLETFTIDRSNGVRLACDILGQCDAPMVVLTHGWGLDSTIWPHEFLDVLASRWRVVRWDLPGFGNSTWGSRKDVTAETLAADLDAVLDHLDGQPVLLVGHSFGGMLLETHARLFPERASKQLVGLVMIDVTYTSPIHTARNRRALERIERPLIRPMLHVARHTSPLVRLINTLAYFNGSAHLATRIAMFGKAPPWNRLDHLVRLLIRPSTRVTVPVLLAMLEHDEDETLPTIALLRFLS